MKLQHTHHTVHIFCYITACDISITDFN